MDGFLRLHNGDRVPVRDGLILGRVAGCDVVIDDGKASRRHARLVVQGGVVEIEDLQSSNGTLLNGKPVTRRMLRVGDEIQIGTTVIRFEAAEGPGAAAAAAGHDEVDLFADDEEENDGVTAAPPPPTRPAPPPAPPPAPKPAAGQLVEFEDEVGVVNMGVAHGVAAAAGGGTTEPVVQARGRLLQYAKKEDRGGLLGDDLRQMNPLVRGILIVLVLAAAVGLFWLVQGLV